MMKEICAQCLQLHMDPVTGKETVVFSCFNQDQALDRVDFACLRQRLRQNGVQEKLAALWLDRSLRRTGRAMTATIAACKLSLFINAATTADSGDASS